MVLAGTVTPLGRAIRAPFRVHGTSLPPNLLLIAKLVVVGLFFKRYHLRFPDVFAPMAPFFDVIPAPYLRLTFETLFVIAAIALLLNRAVRTSCVVLGVVFIVATMSSRVAYHNANVFVGLLFLMIGLQDRDKPPTLLAWQLGLMYFGAGLNKLLEPDWRSGQYFAYFLAELLESDLYVAAAALLPDRWLALYLCWHVIAAELVAGALFFIPRYRRLAVWIAAGVHAAAAMMAANDFGIYFSAVLASYLIVLNWPADLVVRWKGAGVAGLLVWCHQLSHGSDPTIRYENEGAGALQIRTAGRTFQGLAAYWRLALWTPVLYLPPMVLLTVVRGPWRWRAVRGSGAVAAVVLAVVTIAWLHARWRRRRGHAH